MKIDGLDAVLVGPHNLSCSLGIPEKYNDPPFIEAVDHIIEKARAKGIGAGVHAFSKSFAETERHWMRRGTNLIMHSVDMIATGENLGDAVQDMRRKFDDLHGTFKDNDDII